MNPSTWTSVVTRRRWEVVEPRMFTEGGAHGRRSQGWRGPTPPRKGGRKGWYLWRELCFCGEAGRESNLPTGDPPPSFAAFLIKKFSFLAKKASPSLFKPLPFYLAICGLWHKLFRCPIHSYFKDLISFPVMSLYTLEPPFHFTELFFIPLIFFKKNFISKTSQEAELTPLRKSREVEKEKRRHTVVKLHFTGFQRKAGWVHRKSVIFRPRGYDFYFLALSWGLCAFDHESSPSQKHILWHLRLDLSSLLILFRV